MIYGFSVSWAYISIFPDARIIGADINKHSLLKCRSLRVGDKISFVYSKQEELEKHGPYDAIFCMAVLQRKPHATAAKKITSLKKIYPFKKFEQQVIGLDKMLNPTGLLIIHYTQYLLNDTVVASKYESLGNYGQEDYVSPVYDRNSNVINNPCSFNSIFIKCKN